MQPERRGEAEAKRSAQAHYCPPERAEPHLEGSERKKMVRRAARRSVENGEGTKSAACRALGLAMSGLPRQAKASAESRRIRKEMLELSAKHPRYGYRRITAQLRRGQCGRWT
jgi:hypothetical protein